MKTGDSTFIFLLLLLSCLTELQGQSICIKLKSGTQFSYPTSCIRKISFENKQVILDLINPTPVILHIDSIQVIKFIPTPPLTIMDSEVNKKKPTSTIRKKVESNNVLTSFFEEAIAETKEFIIYSI